MEGDEKKTESKENRDRNGVLTLIFLQLTFKKLTLELIFRKLTSTFKGPNKNIIILTKIIILKKVQYCS